MTETDNSNRQISTPDSSVLTSALREAIEAYYPRYPNRQAVVLPALHLVQEKMRCVPTRAIVEIAEMLGLAPAEVHDAMSFYGFFRDEENPLGEHRAWLCRSISCSIRGGEQLLEYLCKQLEVEPGNTTNDGKLTVEYAECLGACEFAPCMLLDGVIEKDLSQEKIDQVVDRLD